MRFVMPATPISVQPCGTLSKKFVHLLLKVIRKRQSRLSKLPYLTLIKLAPRVLYINRAPAERFPGSTNWSIHSPDQENHNIGKGAFLAPFFMHQIRKYRVTALRAWLRGYCLVISKQYQLPEKVRMNADTAYD